MAPAAGLSAAAVLALVAIHIVAPQRTGPVALTQIVEPYLLPVCLMAVAITVPLAAGQWRHVALAVGMLLVLVGALRYGPNLVSFPTAETSSDALDVVAWNIMAGPDGVQRLRDGLIGVDADLVGLEELQFEAAEMLNSDVGIKAAYPHEVLNPHANMLGVGLLSRHPIGERQKWTDPPLIRAVVQPEGSAPVTVFVGHPLPARIATVAGVPVGVDTTDRDQRIERIRGLVDLELTAGRDVLVIGDLNVTDHEPAYGVLAAGFRDAHLEAGIGPGFTWRAARLAGLPLGLLRIDYILASPKFAVSASAVDCSEPSDHCRVSATVWRTPE